MQPARSTIAAVVIAFTAMACRSDATEPIPDPCPLGLVGARVQPANLTMTVGQSQGLTAQRAIPGEGCTHEFVDGSFTWTTSNSSVALVSNTGMVNAVAPGQVTITARSTDDEAQSASAAIQVVSPP